MEEKKEKSVKERLISNLKTAGGCAGLTFL
jgi:hypothetical protein